MLFIHSIVPLLIFPPPAGSPVEASAPFYQGARPEQVRGWQGEGGGQLPQIQVHKTPLQPARYNARPYKLPGQAVGVDVHEI